MIQEEGHKINGRSNKSSAVIQEEGHNETGRSEKVGFGGDPGIGTQNKRSL